MTRGLLTSSKTLDKLYKKKMRKDKTHITYTKYKQYRYMFNRLKRITKQKYYFDLLNNYQHDTRKTWGVLKSLIGKQNDKSGITEFFKIGKENVTNPDKIANGFCEFFTEVGQTYTDKIPKPNVKFKNINKSRCFSEHNIHTFKDILEKTNFEHINQINDANAAYKEFMILYHEAFDKAFPLRNVTYKNKRIKREPWITTGIIKSSKTKSKLLAKKLKQPTDENIQTYKQYNNILTKTKKAMKKAYFQNALNENKYNIKKVWSILKIAISKQSNKSSFPLTFMINDAPISDRSHICESFNDYFSSIGIQTSKNVPKSDKSFSSYMPNQSRNSMYLEPIEPQTVLEATNKLKTKLSSGHDNISTKLIKETINQTLEPLTHIINRSFETGVVPQDMKIAKVIPIFKAGDDTLMKNYRPISLLPAFSKILERIMYNKLMGFLNCNNILYKHQYGFRAKHSTIHPILHFLNHCAESSNKPNPEYTSAIFCDLSKAFDVIDHSILINKLRCYGIRGIVNDWIANYLANRKQSVEIDSHRSSLQNVKCGVPQGSILGPLLYLIYVNDISNSCSTNILSFADDTTLYSSNSDVKQLISNANSHINDLFQWFCANKLSLNANKTKYIIIKPKQKKINMSDLNIHINNTPLTRIGNDCKEKATKFLGIFIDENLSWTRHVANVNSKIARSVFMIKQVKYTLPHDSLQTLYYALIQSHLNYGILAWGNASCSTLKKTKILQKRAIRCIHKSNYNSHTDPLFKRSKLKKIQIYTRHKCSYLFMTTLITNYHHLSMEHLC